MLILGKPGTGKTTTLLELTRDLLDRAENDEGHPIPVVFSLAAWPEHSISLDRWLVNELKIRYKVDQEIAQSWVQNQQILPLLDSLDEVKSERVKTCVEMINSFRQSNGLLQLVVCSRISTYENLEEKLNLQGAILIQPLHQQQIEEYIVNGGENLNDIQQILHCDPTFYELLDTPLMLSIISSSNIKISNIDIWSNDPIDNRINHIFNYYFESMISRRSKVKDYPCKRILEWLSWIAKSMYQNNQSILFVERIQPWWLKNYEYSLGSIFDFRVTILCIFVFVLSFFLTNTFLYF